MKTSMLPLLTLCLLTGCASYQPEATMNNEMSAVCAAQGYLLRNGYLGKKGKANSVDLELWDKIKYEGDDGLDWDRLLSDRQNSFKGRLSGVADKGEGVYLVYYKAATSYTCVRVSESEQDIALMEANCRPLEGFRPVHDRNVRC